MSSYQSSTNIDICPKVVDGIPCYQQKMGDVFDEKYGRISIEDCWDLSQEPITSLLLQSKAIFVDRQDMLVAVLQCIKDANHTVFQLTDEHIDQINPEFDSHRRRHGAISVCHVFIIKHAGTGNIIIFYNCFQISSTIGGVR